MSFTQQQVANMVRKRQGRKTDTAFAAELGVSCATINLIRLGLRLPGPKVLKALGLKTVIVADNGPEMRHARDGRNGRHLHGKKRRR